MLVDSIKHAFIRSVGAIKYFALTVQDKFLEIKSHSFCNAEILGILRNADLHFLANAEEMVNSIPAGEDHPGILLYLYFLFTEIPCRYALQADERIEVQFYAILS